MVRTIYGEPISVDYLSHESPFGYGSVFALTFCSSGRFLTLMISAVRCVGRMRRKRMDVWSHSPPGVRRLSSLCAVSLPLSSRSSPSILRRFARTLAYSGRTHLRPGTVVLPDRLDFLRHSVAARQPPNTPLFRSLPGPIAPPSTALRGRPDVGQLFGQVGG